MRIKNIIQNSIRLSVCSLLDSFSHRGKDSQITIRNNSLSKMQLRYKCNGSSRHLGENSKRKISPSALVHRTGKALVIFYSWLLSVKTIYIHCVVKPTRFILSTMHLFFCANQRLGQQFCNIFILYRFHRKIL